MILNGFQKNHFQNRYLALETPSRPPPFMAKGILKFHFDYLTPSLIWPRESWQWLWLTFKGSVWPSGPAVDGARCLYSSGGRIAWPGCRIRLKLNGWSKWNVLEKRWQPILILGLEPKNHDVWINCNTACSMPMTHSQFRMKGVLSSWEVGVELS